MKTREDVRIAQENLRRSQMLSGIEGLPPGYIVGLDLSLTSESKVEIAPGVLNVAGKLVKNLATHTLLSSEWDVNKDGSTWYYVYLTTGAQFHVDSIEYEYSTKYMANYHPAYERRCIGRLYVEEDSQEIVIAQALSDEVADTKVFTFLQASVPTATAIGDLWIDTDDGCKLYRAASVGANEIAAGEWEDVHDTTIDVGAIHAREMSFADDVYQNDDEIPADTELFDLQQPDCVSNLGLHPKGGKLISFFPASWKDELEDEHDNDHVKWPGDRGAVGVFKATENLVADPEDLTTANWTNVQSTDELSDYYINGKRFTKVICNGIFTAYVYQVLSPTTASPSFQAIVKKGNHTGETQLSFWDNTAGAGRGRIKVAWATETVTSIEGLTNLEYEWISDEVVWIAGTANSVNTGNVNWLVFYPNADEAAGRYAYCTAIQFEDISYPTPYTPTDRAAGRLDYPLSMPSQFTIMFWVRPWFPYTTTVEHRFIEWYIDATHELRIWYAPTIDKFQLYWEDGGTARTQESQQFDDGSSHEDINAWIHVAIKVDLTTGDTTGSSLWINGVKKDDSWSGNIDAKTSSFNELSIGHEASAIQVDSLITDFLYAPSLLADSEITDHHTANRPYYDPDEVASSSQSVRINKSGMRMHNAGLTLSDRLNRLIDISNEAGLLARDATGKIIHDIPDAPILLDMIYGGHVIWREAPANFSNVTLGYTDVQVARTATSATTNVDISAVIPTGLTNVKGIICSTELIFQLAAGKMAAATYIKGLALYSTKYNTLPSAFNRLARFWHRSAVAGIQYDHRIQPAVPIPVVYDAGVPYITWNCEMGYSAMAAGNAYYALTAQLFILGVIV